tara:strand:+ start:1583 stop:2215 length:633 start_codon:yes stop_codon:yes gene_type:complete
MSNLNISIFGSKTFFEIINEIKLFSKYKIKFYDNFDICIKDAVEKNFLSIFFVNKNNIKFLNNIKEFPTLLITESSNLKKNPSSEICEYLNKPFTIFEFQKKITLLIAKNEFKKNSLITLGKYTIDKNERKIKKDNLEIRLSEKEINFLILFSKRHEPISRKLVLKNVWKYSSESETHTVETHIHRLRKKILENFGDDDFIKNSSKGYYI